MENEASTPKRRRFYKPYSFSNDPKKGPFKNLRKVFQIVNVLDLHEELKLWQKLALANDQSVYDEGYAREDLMDFCDEFLRLTEALYIIHVKHAAKFGKMQGNKKAFNLTQEMNQPILLNEEDISKSEIVVRSFVNTFSYRYTKREMQDLLEAVITYDGHKRVYKGTLLLFYDCILCLLDVTYIFDSKELPAN